MAERGLSASGSSTSPNSKPASPAPAKCRASTRCSSSFAEAIETARVDVVPKIMIHSGGANGTSSTGNVMEALLTLLLADKMGAETTPNPPTPRSAAAEAVRSRIEQGLKEQK